MEREVVSEVLSKTEKIVVNGYEIQYNYSLVENKIQGAITATVQPYGNMATYDGVNMISGMIWAIGDADRSQIESQIETDMQDIANIYTFKTN
jgi:hypothetical protein